MTDPKPGETHSALEEAGTGGVPVAKAPSAPEQPEAVKELTPEEQMALYEKDLKENDWGHQPC